MSTEKEEDRVDFRKETACDKEYKEKALSTAMKLGTQCSRTIESVIENSNMIYKFLSDKKEK
jgi:hypothetical protein